MYDTRIGRRWNVDPVTVPSESPYAAFRNNPIILNDPNGDCAGCDKPEGDGSEEGAKETTTTTFTGSAYGMSNLSTSYTKNQDWYWHAGSLNTTTDADGNEVTTGHEKGWYTSSQYKNILTGTSWGSTENIPLSIKWAFGDFFGFDGGTVTEKDLTTDQLIALRKMALKNYSRGVMKIDYPHYGTHAKGSHAESDITSIRSQLQGTSTADRRAKTFSNPYYVLKTSIGAATLVVEDGKLYVVDQYNFNNAAETQAGRTKLELIREWREVDKSIASDQYYERFRNAGSYLGSPNGEGATIKILIKQF